VALGARVGPLGSGVLDVRSGRVTFIDGSWGFELSREVFFFLALLRFENQIARGRERGHSPLLSRQDRTLGVRPGPRFPRICPWKLSFLRGKLGPQNSLSDDVVRIGPSGRGLVSLESALGSPLF
jgi:hypothetical protein